MSGDTSAARPAHSYIRNQRWLPTINTGLTTIPSFGCVEIVTAAPESDYLADGSSNRLIYEVRRPTGADYLDVVSGVNCDIRCDHFGFNSELYQPPGVVGEFTLDLPCIGLVERFTDETGSAVVQTKDYIALPHRDVYTLRPLTVRDDANLDIQDQALVGCFRPVRILEHWTSPVADTDAMLLLRESQETDG